MHIINDFFLVTWNQKESVHVVFDETLTEQLSYNYTHDSERFCDSVAIALIIHFENSEAISTLESSKKILNHLFNALPFTKENIQKAQKTILYFLIQKGNLSINNSIANRFERLRKEEIISYDVSRRLMSFLTLIEEKREQKKKESPLVEVTNDAIFDYHTEVEKLNNIAHRLRDVIKDEAIKKRVEQSQLRLKEASFSIGVTGVMNAGKSTMLNALLGQEVLGTAVVPETANLTLISYAKEPYAKVNFWTHSQWQKIEQSALSLQSMQDFVTETKKHFGEHFSTWVSEKGRSENIEVKDLALYTSAKGSEKKCNLVKSVELFTDIGLLEEGVAIVDTPGLDDPVVQREEITLSYLNECDVLIHLMNAAQAATQKDVDFIIDALLYRKVAQLLIVITRIDAISKAELEEVIAYTKQSITRRLEEHNQGAMLNQIIAKLHFMPLAGKLALWHKLGRGDEALALGYNYEQTGMPHFESYLKTLLFGAESMKANITLSSNTKEMLHCALTCKAILEEKITLLSLSKEEIEAQYHAYFNEKKEQDTKLEALFSALGEAKNDMVRYFVTLRLFAQNKADALASLLYRRIMDDVSYERSKYKRTPKEERIAYMVESGLKDGVVDVIRDYRYEFQKKMQGVMETLEVHYSAFANENEQEMFDVKSFCDMHFAKAMLFKNSDALVFTINQAIAKEGKKEGTKLSLLIEKALKEEINSLKQSLWEILELLNESLLSAFVQSLESPARELESQMQRKEQSLSEALLRLEKNKGDEASEKEQLNEQHRVLKEVVEALHVRSVK